MPPEVRKLIADMADASRAIADFTRGRACEDLARDELLRSAIYWQFVVIGEALAQWRRLDESSLSRISEWQRIIAFRNQIIHGYSVVDDEITWRIITDKLPILAKELNAIVAPPQAPDPSPE